MKEVTCTAHEDQGEGATDQRHTIAPPEQWPWLPKHDSEDLAQHPYCERCGAVKIVGTHAGLSFGTLVNIVGRLRRRLRQNNHKITEAQQRLILQRLRVERADDGFALPRSTQIETVAQTVHHYTGIDTRYIKGVLRSC